MIHYTLRGGLANMMFGIAATHSIALSKGTKPSFNNRDNQLVYLDKEKIFNPKLKHSSEYLRLDFFKNMITETAPTNTKVYSYPFHFQELPIIGDVAIIDGFFQSEKYFKNHEKEIKKLFKPTKEIIKIINDKYSNILSGRTTSIHVRRGDYVRHPQHHPIQTLEYYQKGIELTKDKTDLYVVFSDDVEWCKKHFQGDNVTFIEKEKDYIEIYLMSMCDNNIIANSSFSWWGAWLNNNPDKIVVGPKRWFGPAYNHFNTNDIIPENWIKI